MENCGILANFAPQMEIISDIENVKSLPECAATIGVFDGVHAGHQQIIKQMICDAKDHGFKSMVITFDRQPRELFDANYHPQLLTTQKNKVFLLSLFEVDYVVVLPFTMEMARLSAHDFMQQVLKDKLNVKLLRLGYDNRFGHGRKEGFEDYSIFGCSKEEAQRLYIQSVINSMTSGKKVEVSRWVTSGDWNHDDDEMTITIP